MSNKINGGELCVRTLKSAGCTDVFCLHGGHLDPLFQSCIDHDIRLIDTRHEAAAAHAADAYARQTGRPGVVFVTAGPGFTNAITAITQAYLDRSPILVIAGASPLRDAERWPLQGGIDQVAMVKPVTRWAAQVTRTDLIPHMVSQALRMTMEGAPGPVVLEIPIDVLFNPIDDPNDDLRPTPIARPAPSDADSDSILSTLSSAKRPAILVGGGALLSRCEADLVRFAELTGIPVYTNNKARGIIPSSHPLSAGALSNMKVAQAAGIGTPDVVLALGLRFGMFTEPGMLGPGRLPPEPCTIIQVDVCSAELGRIRHADIGIVADAGATLIKLLARTEKLAWPNWQPWSESLRALVDWHRLAYAEVTKKTALIHPYAAVSEILDVLGPGTIVCADGGEASAWAEMVARPESAGELMSHGYLGCLGIGMPFAIGAQIANPDKRVVVIVGDGSAGFNIQEFDTMVRHDLPIVTIVLNNKAWGMCVHGQQAMYGDNRLIVTKLAEARYEQVAAGFGCDSDYVERLEDIAPAVSRALGANVPACINVSTRQTRRRTARSQCLTMRISKPDKEPHSHTLTSCHNRRTASTWA
jgi:acetolactate synthase-1/2/3 large subunit